MAWSQVHELRLRSLPLCAHVQVCALWQPALQLADEPRCEVVSGRLPAEAYTQPCSVCRHQASLFPFPAVPPAPHSLQGTQLHRLHTIAGFSCFKQLRSLGLW